MLFSSGRYLQKTFLLLGLCSLFFSIDIAFGQTYSFHSPLVDAADRGDIIGVEEWLNQGYPVDHKGDFQTTALSRAAFRGHKKIVELLIEKGASINDSDIAGASPLLMATRQGKQDIVELLIKHKANVNQADREGWTPLMRASLADNKKLVSLLMAHHADPSLVNSAGETASDFNASLAKAISTKAIAETNLVAFSEKDQLFANASPAMSENPAHQSSLLSTQEEEKEEEEILEQKDDFNGAFSPITTNHPSSFSKDKILSHPGKIDVGMAIPVEETLSPAFSSTPVTIDATKKMTAPAPKKNAFITQKDGTYWANIALFSTEKEAQAFLDQLRKEANVHSLRLVHSQKNKEKSFYSLQAGSFSTYEKARNFCLTLKDGSKKCKISRAMKEINRHALREKALHSDTKKHMYLASTHSQRQHGLAKKNTHTTSINASWLLFGSYPQQHLAKDQAQWLQESFPALLSHLSFKTELPAHRGQKSMYRLKGGPTKTKDDALHICKILKKESVACVPLTSH